MEEERVCERGCAHTVGTRKVGVQMEGGVEEGGESKRAEGETDRKTETDKDKERQGETVGTRLSLSPFKGMPPGARFS